MRLLYLSVLVIIAFIINRISAGRYVSMENTRYRPYENLFNKKPKLQFRQKYYNRYISNAVHQIDKKLPKVNVCFTNMITIEDPLLNGYDPIYKDSRTIAEYEFSKISKYTSLKFYLATKNCHMYLDFDHPLSKNTLGWTTFYVFNGIPQANIQMDRVQIKNYAISARISYLRAFMQILMHEILHGLGLGHSVDDHNSKSMIRAIYDGSTQQLLYKKDVYNLRSIYGARRRQTALSNVTIDKFDYPEPSEWDDLVLRNMEDNSPEIDLNINKDVSSTTNNPVKTTTIITSTTSKAQVKTTTNKSFIPTGAVKPIDTSSIESTTMSQVNQSTTKKPCKTTTNNPIKSTAYITRKTTTHMTDKSTMKTTEEPNEITSRKPTKTTTKRPEPTTSYRPSKTITEMLIESKVQKSNNSVTLNKATTYKSTRIISEADLQKEFNKVKYLLSHKTATERLDKTASLSRKPDPSTTYTTTTEKSTIISEADLQREFSKAKYLLSYKTTTNKPTSLSRKPDKSTTNRPDETTEKSIVISQADLQKIFSKAKYLLSHKTTTERSDESTTNI